MKKKTLLFLLTLMILSATLALTACGGRRNLFEGDNWSMEIFGGWYVQSFGQRDFLFAPDSSGSNINILSESLGGFSLEESMAATIEVMPLTFDNFVLISSEHMEINGKNAMTLFFTSDDFMDVHTTYQFVVEHGGMGYIITYTRMNENDHLDAVLEMVNTFTVR